MPWRSAWLHVRAALVLLHAIAVVVLAVPSLRAGLNRSSWADPTVQDEFRAWADRFGMAPKDFEERAWSFVQKWTRLHERITAPFEPYRKYAGVRQPWVMFVAPHRYPTKVEIAVFEDHQWRTIYRERSSEHEWMRRLFDHDRMRSAFFRFGWDQFSYDYRLFVEWVAKQAKLDFPRASSVRVRMERRRTPTPDEVRAGRIPDVQIEREIIFSP